jgi:hypothetical protein
MLSLYLSRLRHEWVMKMGLSVERRISRGATHGTWEKCIPLGAIALLILVGVSGCSLYLEHKRPDYTDVGAIQKGTPRYQVTAAFGKPIESYKKDGNDVDVFQADPKGRYAGTKTAVTTFNTVADIFSIGMWKAVATPAEMLTKHKLTTYVVTYAPDQTVASIETVVAPPKPEEETAATTSPSSAPTTPLDSASPTAPDRPAPMRPLAPVQHLSPAQRPWLAPRRQSPRLQHHRANEFTANYV